jgi:hypothetical protein
MLVHSLLASCKSSIHLRLLLLLLLPPHPAPWSSLAAELAAVHDAQQMREHNTHS